MAQVIAAITIGRWVYVSSYRATRNEKTPLARANALRELTHSDKENKFNHQELFDLCESCKRVQRMSL
jgi:hypothetical protein